MAVQGIGNLNLNVNITVYSPDGNNSQKSTVKIYKGRIYQRELDQNVVIELVDTDSTEFLNPGKPILLFLAHDLGLYIFSAKINKKDSKDGLTLLYCDNLTQVKFFQRRQSVRVQVSIPVNFSPEFDRSAAWEGTIIDISTGGLQVSTSFYIPPETVLELVYQLEDIGPVFMDGKVIRSLEQDGQFIQGLEYLYPDRHSLDVIARFIMAEQQRQKRLGLQIFKAFILKSTIEVQTPTVFSIVQFKSLDISVLQGKTCAGTITEISIHDIKIECPLKIPLGAVLEFSFELPQLGYSTIQAVVRGVDSHLGKYSLTAEFNTDYEEMRDCLLESLARDFKIPYNSVD
jgi:c-di-GMP-binding flagellar brake protein YcgR